MTPFEKFQRILITILLVAGGTYGGYYLGKRGYIFEVRKNPPKIEITNQYPGDTNLDFALFWRVWNMVNAEYLERPIDPKKLMYGAIQGMVAALDDPYSSFLAPKINTTVNNVLKGNYEGIGAELGIRDNTLIVISPMDGSPAKEAGIKPGDKILEIEKKPTNGITVSEAVTQIRGESGTVVSLTIQTDNTEPREVAIRRGVINVPSIAWSDRGDGTGYIRVSRFYGEESNREWDKAIKEMSINMPELDAIIVDVRDNPGGYMQSAIYLADDFVKEGPVMYQESSLGEQLPFNAERLGNFESVPAVFVLINGGSASASEILAGALRDRIGAKLIGEKSFGKGTIQTAEDFEDGSGIHLTIAKWLTPNKVWVHNNGIVPDVEVENTDEDIKNGKDAQLEKAIELAKEI